MGSPLTPEAHCYIKPLSLLGLMNNLLLILDYNENNYFYFDHYVILILHILQNHFHQHIRKSPVFIQQAT